MLETRTYANPGEVPSQRATGYWCPPKDRRVAAPVAGHRPACRREGLDILARSIWCASASSRPRSMHT